MTMYVWFIYRKHVRRLLKTAFTRNQDSLYSIGKVLSEKVNVNTGFVNMIKKILSDY